MSKQIDERVVSMQFDNAQFEREVATTTSSVNKLKDSLRFEGASKGFEEVGTAARRVDFSPMSNGLQQVSLKFNALYTMADQTMRRITDSVINYGKRIASALTIDPIKTGFQEYETQIGAVQTILANTESKGSTLQDVNKALDELNVYADKTIYNFTEMTKNIGTFTAAGIELDTSVKSIQGIANLAAVSGSTSQQASTAMYQLSQALSSGTVKLMDWNSVVNAGMGGQVFQDALLMTAGRIGKTTKSVVEMKQELTDTYGSFRESLQTGWITSEVLTKTLEHFTMAAEEGSAQWNVFMKQLKNEGYTEEQAKEIIKMANTATDAATKVKTLTQLWSTLQETAQSGWTQTWEIIVGDFEEAKEFYTEISNTLGGMIDGMSQARNKILEGALSSGWKQLLGTGIVDEEEYKNNINEVAKAHGVSMEDMIKAEKELDKTISDSEAYDRALKKGLKEGKINADMLTESIGKMADKMSKMSDEELIAAGYTYEDVEAMKQLKAQFDSGELSMSKFVDKMFEMSGREKLIEALRNAFKGLMSVVKPIGDAFNEIFHLDDTEGMIGKVKGIVDAIVEFSKKLTISEDTADKLKRTFKGLFAVLSIVWQLFKAVAKSLSPVVGWMGKLVGWILEGTALLGDFLTNLDKAIKETDSFGKALAWIAGFFKNIWQGIKIVGAAIADVFLIPMWEVFIKFLDRIGIRFDGIRESTQNLKDGVSSVLKGLGESLKGSKFYNFLVETWDMIKEIGKGFAEVFGVLFKALGDAMDGATFSEIADLILAITGGGLMVSISQFISRFSQIGKTFRELFEGITDCLGDFQTQLKSKVLKELAISLLLISVSLIALALIDSKKLAGASAALVVFLGGMLSAMTYLSKMDMRGKKGQKLTKMLGNMLFMAISISVIASALKKIGNIPVDNLVASTLAIAGLMAAMMGAINMIPTKKVDKVAGTLIGMGIALNIFAVAIRIIGNLGWEKIIPALTGLAGGLGVMVAALHLLPKGLAGKAGGLVFIATAMTILGGALKIFATMSWDEMTIALTSLAGSLGILITALTLMGMSKGIIAGAAAILIVSPALATLAGVLKLMGATLSHDEIVTSLTALGGSLGILAVGLNLMKGAIPGAFAMLVVAPALFVLSGALAALGVLPLPTIGVGLLAIAGAFVVLGAAGYVLGGVAPVIMILATAILMLSASVGVAGAGMSVMAVGITALAAALAGGATLIVNALKDIILGIVEMIPVLAKAWGKAIVEFCKVIIDNAPTIKEAIKVFFKNLIAVFIECIPLLVVGLGQLIVGLLDALIEFIPMINERLFNLIILVLKGLSERIPEIIAASVELIMSIFKGTAEAIKGVDKQILEEGLAAMWIIAEMLAVLTLISVLTPTALAGVISLGVILAHIGAILWAFGKLEEIPGLKTLVSGGGNLLQAIGKGIGQFFGGIIGGVAQGVTSALPQIGKDLTGFMDNAKPFFDGIKDVNQQALAGIKSLAEAILILTAADVVDGLTWIFTGGNTLQGFANELPYLGTGIRDLLTNVGVLTEAEVATIDCVAQAVLTLANAADQIPNTGGFVGVLVGNNDLKTFAEQFPSVGKALRNLLTSEEGLGGVDFTAANVATVKNVADAVIALAKAANQIPNSGGWVGAIVGENDLGKFAEEFPKVGAGLRGLLTAIGENGLTDAEQATIGTAGNAIAALATAADSIPNGGGWLAALIGDNDFSDFATQLPDVGKGIKGFADNVGEFTQAKVRVVEMAVRAISAVASLGKDKVLKNLNDRLDKFGDKLINFGKDISEWATKMAGINSQSMSFAISRVGDVVTMATRVADYSVESLKTFGDSLVEFAEDGIQGFADAFTDKDPLETAKSGANALVDAAVGAMKSTDNYNKFYNAGVYLAKGFSNGVSSKSGTKSAGSAGASIGLKALAGLNNSLDEHSPSREAFKSGRFFTVGAVNGIVDNLKSVYNAGGEVGSNAMDGLSDALSKISNAVSMNIDADPVIRPVVDLSDVEAGANIIGSLFGSTQSMRVLGNVGMISSMMNNRQNGVNDDVVSAINELSQRISNMDRPSYTINGVTYDDGSNIRTAVETIVRAARIERRN